MTSRSTESPLSDTDAAKPTPYTYVLITPARNEAGYIEGTIKSVVGQTVRPARWVIVSDGSTDGTDEIVKRYAAEHDWIELVRMPERKERDFAAKVRAFNAGYDRVKGLRYDIIGSIDADISFEPGLFELLLKKFGEDPQLGLAGAPFAEANVSYDFRFSSVNHVSGACQLFRRACFEDIGGYKPIRGGGIDVIAVLTARMKGWKTRTFTEKTYEHHRKIGTAKNGDLRARFKDGEKDYVLGAHPVWEVFRSLYQTNKRPLIAGGCALLAGYLWAAIRRAERAVSPELMRFRRDDQMDRLKRFITSRGRCRDEKLKQG